MSERLVSILDWFRSKLAEEQLRLADALASNEELQDKIRQLEKNNVQEEGFTG